MMEDGRINELVRRHEKIKGDRGVFNSHWQEIADRVWPERGQFNITRTPGMKLHQKVFDSTAVNALPKFASAMESLIVPMTQKWHTLTTTDDELNDKPSVKAWLEKVRDHLFNLRYRPHARFQQNINLVLKEVGAFGNGVLYIEPDYRTGGFSYLACDLANCYWLTKYTGEVDTMHREYPTTPRMLQQQFKQLPPLLQAKHDTKPDEPLRALHCVRPTDEMSGLPRIYRKPFSAWYMCLDTREMLGEETGYSSMPYAVGRDDLASGELYGRGAGARCLADVKMLNQIMKTVIRQANRAVAPPMLLAEDGILQAFSLQPNALNPGTMTMDGKPLVMELPSAANFQVAQEIIDSLRRSINDTFLITLFQILVEEPRQMTATEIMIRLQEKGQLLGPSAAKLQSDLLGTLIERELMIITENGAFHPDSWLAPPPELEGVDIKAEYTSVLNQMMRTPEGVAMDQFVQHVSALAAIDPTAVDIIDSDKASTIYADVLGVPRKAIRDEDAIAAIRAQRKQTNDAAMAVQAAPLAASAAKDLATAQATQATTGNPGTSLPIPTSAVR